MRATAAAVACAVSAAWSLRDALRRFDDYTGPETAAADELMFVLRLGLALAVFAAAGWLLARRSRIDIDGAALRGLLYCLLWGLMAGTIASALSSAEHPRWSTRNGFFSGLHVATLIWAVRHWRAPGTQGSKPPSAIDWLTMNAITTLVVLEVSLAVWVWVYPTPLTTPVSVEKRLDAMRRPPHSLHHGESLNSGGFADDEFFTAEEGDFVAVFLADSFGLAVVPISENFVAVAEARARAELAAQYRRVAFHNFGVPAVGPAEYARLYLDEAAATRPNLVVLNIFLGNDVHGSRAFEPTSNEPERYGLHGWLVTNAARRSVRLLRISREERARVAAIGAAAELAPPGLRETPADARPTFTVERFLEIESERVELSNPLSPDAGQFPDFLSSLDRFADQLGDRLLVVLIPDEYHVNDALYAELMALKTSPDDYVRFSPQTIVLDHCKARRIECLDLTPALRTAESEAHTYRLRDTHWNKRGNRIAGEVIADAIIERAEAAVRE